MAVGSMIPSIDCPPVLIGFYDLWGGCQQQPTPTIPRGPQGKSIDTAPSDWQKPGIIGSQVAPTARQGDVAPTPADSPITANKKDFRFTSDVLITEVKVPYRSSEAKDSEVSEDRLFAEKLNAAKTEDLPVVYLFKQGQLDSPVRLEEKSFSADSLRQFVRSQVPSVRVLLESCVASLDELAANFVDPQKAGQRKALLKDAQAKVELLKADQKQSGKVYLKLMEKVIERGDMFLQSERERIKNLLAGQMSDVKKKQLQTRLNILESFQAGSASKDEL